MRIIEISDVLSCKKEVLWHLLMDFENYHDWHPYVKSIKGGIKPKKKLTLHLNPHWQKIQTVRVTSLKNNQSFSWLSSWFFFGVLDCHYSFEIKDHENSSTMFTQKLALSGLLVLFNWRRLKRKHQLQLKKINNALAVHLKTAH